MVNNKTILKTLVEEYIKFMHLADVLEMSNFTEESKVEIVKAKTVKGLAKTFGFKDTDFDSLYSKLNN